MSSLTAHQQDAYDDIYERLTAGERFVGLRGYAGTGKTYLAGHLIATLADEDCTVVACAPTHKATQVLRGHMNGSSVSTQTLHSFLGLRLTPDRAGDYTLVPEGRLDALPRGVVFVDEASMVGRAEWAYIDQTPFFVQWVFVGDPAQLPPVNEEASPALDVPGPTLEDVHRQAAENPILSLATQVRTGERLRLGSDFAGDEGVAVTDNRASFMASLRRAFQSDAFERDPTQVRVLAYRNKTVRRYNREIRAALYGEDAPRFEPGEWLVARESWVNSGVPVLTNSEEVRVKKASVTTFEAKDMSTWTVWKLKVRSPTEATTRTAYVLHEDEAERYRNDLDRLRTEAKEDGRKWEAFYELRERFARVDYAYATTVHKAQGSTFDTVFVDYHDVSVCRGHERRALLYVAVTRPARRLALLV